jgi:hypothetical protein
LVPQFNLLGHAAAARNRCDKHALLDFHPELQSLLEPEGWTWCLSNPQTIKILDSIVNELVELFEQPPFFHCGCDESDDLGHCILCRQSSHDKLLIRHLEHFSELLKKQNIRPIIWHDMLLARDDPRWDGYTANGHSPLETANLCNSLPRNIIIADWEYGWPTDNHDPDWLIPLYFKDLGYNVLLSPWRNPDGIEGCGRAVVSKELFGLLVTTWHLTHANDMFNIYYHAARAAWEGGNREAVTLQDRLSFTTHLRHIGWDMKLRRYEQTGSIMEQIASKPHF